MGARITTVENTHGPAAPIHDRQDAERGRACSQDHVADHCGQCGASCHALPAAKLGRGGKRAGAGRPRNDEPTVPMRVPLSKLEEVTALIVKHRRKLPLVVIGEKLGR